ncbi:MAG: transporter substrate-binding domain-containing protein [Pseudomonadota bacterium]
MMVSPNGAVSGIVRDFLELVSQQFGCTFELLVVPRARAFVMLASGEIDIVPSVNRTELRDQTGKFVDVYDKRPMLIALKGPQASSVPDLLRGTTSIGVVRGYDYGQAYTALLDARS